jgi:hypothetical protein
MHVVYFSQELQLRAPAALGCLYHEATHTWVTLLDLENAIKRREEVTVRPATATELKRAEAVAAMFNIGLALREKIGALLDQDAPEVARGKLTAIRDAMEAVQLKPEFLDRETSASTASTGHQA